MNGARRDLGQRGESLAQTHLEELGARTLARNYRTRLGEVDLLVEHDGDLVIVEVKTRRLGQVGLPEEAVGPTKLARLEQLAAQCAAAFGFEDRGWRIDVVAIDVGPGGDVARLEHIRDAYG